MARAYLGLGANVGNRKANLQLALRWLAPACRIVAVSSLYRSEAVVLEGAPPGPDYLNAACEIETDLSPQELLAHAKSIEHAIGRRPAERWAPRPIDIDILLYDGDVIDTDDLTVPHPRIAERPFVIAPLAELASDAIISGTGRTVSELAEHMTFDGIEHVAAPGEWWHERNL
jgi:2-amino-4-hydroxy-6-hydroxymethyldihydropteridine diphosphokinase